MLDIKISKKTSSSTSLGNADSSSRVVAFPKILSIIPSVTSLMSLSPGEIGFQDQESHKDSKTAKCGEIVSSSPDKFVKITSTIPFFTHAICPI